MLQVLNGISERLICKIYVCVYIYMMDCDELGKKGILSNSLLLFQITEHNKILLIKPGLKNVNHVKAKTNKNQQT